MRNIAVADNVISFLKSKHPWLYTDMTEPLRLGLARKCVLMQDCVIVKVGDTWMWAPFTDAAEREAAELVKKRMDPDDGLYLHCSHDPKETRRILGIKEILVPCYIAVRLSKELFDIKTDAVLKPLTHEHDDFVMKTYRMAKYYSDPKEFVYKAIEDGMTGAFVDGKLAGFIGSHKEGPIGMLEVLPKYRRMGLGTALQQYAINTYIQDGRIPYCHVLENNTASLALERSLGFLISETSSIYWLN